MSSTEEHTSVKEFREYLRIKSVHPDPDYGGIVKYLESYARRNDFSYQVISVEHPAAYYPEPCENRPIVIISWEGTQPSLPCILLNSHTDVAPVFPEDWIYDPFSAHKTEDGKIYARGSQDMKCVGIQHLEALKELKNEGIRLSRTINVTFVPDEAIAGDKGMAVFRKCETFVALGPIGFAMDEGIANPGEEMRAFYNERQVYWGQFIAEGQPGHASQFLENTCGYKVRDILNKILAYRDEQEAKLKADPSLALGDVCTITPTILSGGLQHNVVPNRMEVGFDLRITPRVKHEDIDAMLDQWCKECDVSLKWKWKQTEGGNTCTDDDDPWWSALTTAFKQCGVKHTTEIFPAFTDSRLLRDIGIPAIGFSPMNFTPILLHDENEYLDEKIFLRGIEIFKVIFQSVGNVAPF